MQKITKPGLLLLGEILIEFEEKLLVFHVKKKSDFFVWCEK